MVNRVYQKPTTTQTELDPELISSFHISAIDIGYGSIEEDLAYAGFPPSARIGFRMRQVTILGYCEERSYVDSMTKKSGSGRSRMLEEK